MNSTRQKIIGGASLVALLIAVAGVVAVRLSRSTGRNVDTSLSQGGRAADGRNQQQAVVEAPMGTGVTSGSAATSQGVMGTNGVSAAQQLPEPPQTADQKMAEAMQERLDSEDENGALALARKLLHAPDADVRSAVVGVLGWIGVKAIPELSVMLGDEDEEVAQEALDQWMTAIDEIEDPVQKGALLAAAMTAIKDQDALEFCVMGFNTLPEAIAIRNLVGVIQSSNAIASEIAREGFEFVAGEAYTTPEAAEKWILDNTDPEESEPKP